MVRQTVWTLGKPRHLNGDVDDLVDELQLRRAPVVAQNGQTTGKNLHDLHTRDIDHLIQELQLGNLHGRKDRGCVPLCHEGNVDELGGLQLRKSHNFTAVQATGTCGCVQQARPPECRHETVPLVHTHHDAGHQGLKTTGGTLREVQHTSKRALHMPLPGPKSA